MLLRNIAGSGVLSIGEMCTMVILQSKSFDLMRYSRPASILAF